MQRFHQHRLEEQARVARFGEIRPTIHALTRSGHRVVVVRNRPYRSDRWNFFTDFLFDYGLTRFGSEWFEAEKARAQYEQHPAFIWRRQAYEYLNRCGQPTGGVGYTALLNGPLAACNNLYYDLYTVDDNSLLDDDFLERLKNPKQFQGALHELFAEATCLRAGFTIIRENERDGTRRHVEFVAVHKATGQHVLVEAKSRHRAGVMGQPGQRAIDPDLRFRRLINDAVTKDPKNPLALFIDTNLPHDRGLRFFSLQSSSPPAPSKAMASLLDSVRADYGGVDPYNILVLTNHPQHYSDDDRPAPGNQLAAFVSQKPCVDVYRQQAMMDLLKAAKLYGNVPTLFPPDRNQS